MPCELWFLDKDKPRERRDKVLMIDARNVHRRVTRKIYDFTPEQQKNLSAIVWLYRGQAHRFGALVAEHLERMVEAVGLVVMPLRNLTAVLAEATEHDGLPDSQVQGVEELMGAEVTFERDVDQFELVVKEICNAWESSSRDNDSLNAFSERSEPLADQIRDLIGQVDYIYKLVYRMAKVSNPNGRGSSLKLLKEARTEATERLRMPRYFWRQARWLQERFPAAELRDVEGLVKLVDLKELEENDWSLTPGRYVGVAPEEEDEEFDFEETIREIHVQLRALNEEGTDLARQIADNFEEMGL